MVFDASLLSVRKQREQDLPLSPDRLTCEKKFSYQRLREELDLADAFEFDSNAQQRSFADLYRIDIEAQSVSWVYKRWIDRQKKPQRRKESLLLTRCLGPPERREVDDGESDRGSA